MFAIFPTLASSTRGCVLVQEDGQNLTGDPSLAMTISEPIATKDARLLLAKLKEQNYVVSVYDDLEPWMLEQLAKEHAALGGRPLETLPEAEPPAKPKKQAKPAPRKKTRDDLAERMKEAHLVEDSAVTGMFAAGLEGVRRAIEEALENVAKPSRLWTPFLTGSRVYGTPTEDSDVDLVVLTEPETRTKLFDAAEEFDGVDRYGATTSSLVFGGLNLLVETDRTRFLIWKLGTNYLKTQAPVTRDEAVEFFRRLREHFLRIKPPSQSPGKS